MIDQRKLDLIRLALRNLGQEFGANVEPVMEELTAMVQRDWASSTLDLHSSRFAMPYTVCAIPDGYSVRLGRTDEYQPRGVAQEAPAARIAVATSLALTHGYPRKPV